MPTFYNQGVGGNYPERMKLQTIATLNSQDITNNKSNITITCYGYYDYPEYNVVNPTDGAYYLKIDDVTKKSGTQNLSFVGTSPTNKVLIFSWTGDVTHAADGSKTINIKAYQDCPGVTTLDYLYGSNNWTLPTIPRASIPTLSTSIAALGSAVTISTNRASDTFKHTLKYAIGSQTGTIATNVDTSYAWTLPATIANAIPNSKSGVVVITCETYSGTTLVGSKTVSLTVTVPNTSTYLPTVPLPTVTEGATGLTAFTAKIQGKSKFRVRSTATPKYSATISQYKVVIDGGTYYGADITSAIISKSGTVPVQLTVTDSRGYAVTVTVNVTVEAYSPPKINSFTAGRSPTDQGVDLSAPVNFSISPVANQNTKRYIVRFRVAGTTTWTNVIDSTAYYSRATTHTATGVLNANLSYEVELFVSDYFSSASKIIDISTAFELINFRSTGKGIAFGKVSEADAFECALNAIFSGSLSTSGGVNPEISGMDGTTPLSSYPPGLSIQYGGGTGIPSGYGVLVTFHGSIHRNFQLWQTKDSNNLYIRHWNSTAAAWFAWSQFSLTDHTHTFDSLNAASQNYSRTNYGYISFGPMNSSYGHIYTDRPYFYFNKDILVNGYKARTIVARSGDAKNGYEKYNDGYARAWKTLTTTVLASAMTATGPTGTYKSGWIAIGNWPLTFTSAPRSSATLAVTGTAWTWLGSLKAPTTTSAGEFLIYKFAQSDSALEIYVEGYGPA